MSFSNTGRRTTFGGTPRGVTAPQRPAAPAPQQRERAQSKWTSCATFYGDLSAMEVQTVAEFYRTSLCIKLAPAFAESNDNRRFNHDEGVMVVLDVGECIMFRAQLEAFIAGQLTEVTLARDETKRLILLPASAYYENNREMATALAVSIEQDATDKADARSVVFISKQKAVQLADGAESVAFYPELQGLLACVDSFIGGIARLDFGSCRLLEGSGGAPTERAPAPTTQQPVRRGGLGAPAPRPAAPSASTAAPAEPVGAPARVRQSASVSDGDLDAVLGGGAADLDAVLGDTPQF